MFFAAKCDAEPENMSFFSIPVSFFCLENDSKVRLKRGGQEILDSMQQRIVWYLFLACEGGRPCDPKVDFGNRVSCWGV